MSIDRIMHLEKQLILANQTQAQALTDLARASQQLADANIKIERLEKEKAKLEKELKAAQKAATPKATRTSRRKKTDDTSSA